MARHCCSSCGCRGDLGIVGSYEDLCEVCGELAADIDTERHSREMAFIHARYFAKSEAKRAGATFATILAGIGRERTAAKSALRRIRLLEEGLEERRAEIADDDEDVFAPLRRTSAPARVAVAS